MDIGIQEITVVVGAALALAGSIAALTETKKDDEIIAKIKRALAVFSFVEKKEDESGGSKVKPKLPLLQDGAKIIGSLFKRNK